MGDNPFEEPSSSSLSHSQRLVTTGSRSYGGSGGYQPKEVFGDAYVDAEGGNEGFKPELQFQSFQHSSSPSSRGTINTGAAIVQQEQSTVDFEDTGNQPLAGGGGQGGGGGDLPGGGNNPPADAPLQGDPTNAKIWSIQYYRPLFNVDTVQVVQRAVRSLMPFRFGFIETAKTNPDFYGPFWISTTLIFTLAIAGNLYATIKEQSDHSKTNSTASLQSDSSTQSANFFVIVVAAAIIYSYTLVLPMILWGVFKYLKVPVKLMEVICIYGYTLFIFIPVSVVCVIPNATMHWVLTLGACAWSGFFLVSNLLVTVKDIALKRGLIAMLVVGALHAALGFTFKLYFFEKAYN